MCILFVEFRTASLGRNSCRLQLESAAGNHWESTAGDKTWLIWWDLAVTYPHIYCMPHVQFVRAIQQMCIYSTVYIGRLVRVLQLLISQLFLTRNTFYGTRYLSHCSARFAFNPLFVNRVTSLTARVTWCHRSRDHWNHSWSFPIDGLLTPSYYLAPLLRY